MKISNFQLLPKSFLYLSQTNVASPHTTLPLITKYRYLPSAAVLLPLCLSLSLPFVFTVINTSLRPHNENGCFYLYCCWHFFFFSYSLSLSYTLDYTAMHWLLFLLSMTHWTQEIMVNLSFFFVLLFLLHFILLMTKTFWFLIKSMQNKWIFPS